MNSEEGASPAAVAEYASELLMQPSARCVAVEPHRVPHDDRALFERSAAAQATEYAETANAVLLLRRRNDVTMYSKLFDARCYDDATPDYAVLRLFDDANHQRRAADEDLSSVAQPALTACGSAIPLLPRPLLWDATLVERPELTAVLSPRVPCFLAMNRFPVRPECALLFEERWASRSTMLPRQPGLLGFSLLRRRADDEAKAEGERSREAEPPLGEPYTYSTATLWASEAAWLAWREGEGRNAHAASKEAAARGLKRTPVSAWMEEGMAASPIFFDVPVYLHKGRGVHHVVSASEPPPANGSSSVKRPSLAEERDETAPCSAGGDAAWEAMRARLAAYREQWGNADAPVGGQGVDVALGRWCKLQREKAASGSLAEARRRALDVLGFSWVAPSDMEDPVNQADWADMLRRLAAYREANDGRADVPKKHNPDPALGGWVAAVRRAKGDLSGERIAELDAAGFAWEAARKCGSKFMGKLQELQAFHSAHGHTDVADVLGAAHELAQWRCVQEGALKAGLLSPKRAAHLRELGMS